MVKDVYMLCGDDDEKHLANILLITHFIRIGYDLNKTIIIIWLIWSNYLQKSRTSNKYSCEQYKKRNKSMCRRIKSHH